MFNTLTFKWATLLLLTRKTSICCVLVLVCAVFSSRDSGLDNQLMWHQSARYQMLYSSLKSITSPLYSLILLLQQLAISWWSTAARLNPPIKDNLFGVMVLWAEGPLCKLSAPTATTISSPLPPEIRGLGVWWHPLGMHVTEVGLY